MNKWKFWLLFLVTACALIIFIKKSNFVKNILVNQCSKLSTQNSIISRSGLVPDIKNSNLKNAIKVAEDRGFTVISPELYEDDFDNYDFNVLIGMCSGSADGYCKSALFFNKDKFIGVDSEIESSQVNTIWRNDNTIALSYTLYNDSDPFCCPTGGAKIVRFEYDGLVIKPLETIPATNGSAHR